jgi:hypothetical protein
MRPEQRGTFLLIAIVIVVSFMKLMQIGFAISDAAAFATNFEQCVAIGNPIMETYPSQCHSGDLSFVEEIEDVETGAALTLQ